MTSHTQHGSNWLKKANMSKETANISREKGLFVPGDGVGQNGNENRNVARKYFVLFTD